MAWTLYYEDGSIFSSANGAPQDSPIWGAVVVTQDNAPGNDLLGGRECLLHRTDIDQWITCDWVGVIDQFAHYAHLIDCVRPGRWMESGRWHDLMKRAAIDLRGK